MMNKGIRRWPRVVQSKTEASQDCVFARAGRRRARLVAALVASTAISSSLAQAQGGVTISLVTPAREVHDGQPVEPGTVFKPDVGTIYVSFRVAGQKAPVKLRGQWHYLGGGGDRLVTEAEMTVQPRDTSADFRLELPQGRPWPVGDYRFDILSEDVIAGSAAFRVSEP